MTDKYINLGPKIAGATRKSLTSSCHLAQLEALRWLDEHPDQVPGQTITESEMEQKCATYGSAYETGFQQAGGVILDDPEPTDEQLLAGIIRNIDDWQSITSPELLAKYLNTAGITVNKENR